MIDYLKLARIATGSFKWLPPEYKEDMVGHILVKFCEYMNGSKPVMEPRMFTVIARRAAIDWWDYNKKHFGRWVVLDWAVTGDEDVQVDDFESLISRLKPRLQKIMTLYYRYNYTHQEIGAELGVSQQAAHQLYQLALRQLRRRFGHGKVPDGDDSDN